MKSIWSVLMLIAVITLVSACGGGDSTGDAGPAGQQDTGSSGEDSGQPPADAGNIPDAGNPPVDGGSDAGTVFTDAGPLDTGVPGDTGALPDAGQPDTGIAEDTGVVSDAGTDVDGGVAPACPNEVDLSTATLPCSCYGTVVNSPAEAMPSCTAKVVCCPGIQGLKCE